MKYAWVFEHRDSFPVAVMCRVLGVSKAGYFAWRKRRPSVRAQRRHRIRQAVQEAHADAHGIYGSGSSAVTRRQ